MRSLTDALRTAKLDITAIQETRWPGKNLMSSRYYKFYYSGKHDGPREFGTGFMVFGRSRNAVIDFNPVDERICTLQGENSSTILSSMSTHPLKKNRLKIRIYSTTNL